MQRMIWNGETEQFAKRRSGKTWQPRHTKNLQKRGEELRIEERFARSELKDYLDFLAKKIDKLTSIKAR